MSEIHFGSVLARIRNERHLTLQQVMVQTSRSAGVLSAVELGKRFPTLPIFFEIARALQINQTEMHELVEAALRPGRKRAR